MLRIVVIDDDIAIRRIIKNILHEHLLGIVVAESGHGIDAETILCDCQPDVALVDLLLPGQDGVELIGKVKRFCKETDFIMISQASSEDLITQAYLAGIEFFIHKPINVREIMSIIKKVKDNRDLRKAISLISQTSAQYTRSSLTEANILAENSRKIRINKVFSDLGIIGEIGSKDILSLVLLIETCIKESTKYQLAEQYLILSTKLNQDAKTIEQRIRRTIWKALQNLAIIGNEDYYDENFQMYSMVLFDFKEVRSEMDFINKKSQYRGKINVKKFIEGIIFLTDTPS